MRCRIPKRRSPWCWDWRRAIASTPQARNGRAHRATGVRGTVDLKRPSEASKDIRRLESNMQAKMLDIKGFKAQRLPKINLIAQYELFAKYSLPELYQLFQRNSAQFGASFDIPVLAGKSAHAYISQDEADLAKIRVEIARTRSKISADLEHAFRDAKHAEAVRDVARADLDLAREQVSVDLAQNEEGRLPTAALEQARATENEKWLAYYDAQHQADRARLEVLHHTGTLLTSLR